MFDSFEAFAPWLFFVAALVVIIRLAITCKGKGGRYKAEDIQCPVCGYYCTGNGGIGCIDKPKLCEMEKESDQIDKST